MLIIKKIIFVKFLKIYVINNISFIRLIRKLNYSLSVIILKNFKKFLIIKFSINLITILFFKCCKFLNIFLCEVFNILFMHCFYDHKI